MQSNDVFEPDEFVHGSTNCTIISGTKTCVMLVRQWSAIFIVTFTHPNCNFIQNFFTFIFDDASWTECKLYRSARAFIIFKCMWFNLVKRKYASVNNCATRVLLRILFTKTLLKFACTSVL